LSIEFVNKINNKASKLSGDEKDDMLKKSEKTKT